MAVTQIYLQPLENRTTILTNVGWPQ